MKIFRTCALLALLTAGVSAQAPAPTSNPAVQVSTEVTPRQADPGVMFTTIMDNPEVRILRVVISPGGARRVHTHEDVTFHLLMTLDGTLQVTAGNEKLEAKPGIALYMKKGMPHAFTNTGTAPVTVMETFVKPAPSQSPAGRD